MGNIRVIRTVTFIIFLAITITLTVGFKNYNGTPKDQDASKTINLDQDTLMENANEDEINELTQKNRLMQIKTQFERSEVEKIKEERIAELENQIKNYLGNNAERVGISYYDINTGKGISINGDKTFLAGSTIKVQMNMILGDMFQNGQVSQAETLKYTDDAYEEGTGVLQGQDLSNPLDIKLLSQYSIVHSDNIATNMIINRIGYENMRTLIDNKIGHATSHENNYITANDETTLLKLLYSNSEQNPFYAQIIENMRNTDFHDRMDIYLPQDKVAHKIGDYGNYVNDVGIVYAKNPYILSIYTNEVQNASEVIAHVSKLIYDSES